MPDFAVVKGASYILAHVPDMARYSGATQATERILNPDSEYLAAFPAHLRTYEEAVAYPPNQVYIGNITDGALSRIEFPWYDKRTLDACRDGRFGEIMPQDEFIGLLKICDVFDLVKLEAGFLADAKRKLETRSLLSDERLALLDGGETLECIQALISKEHAEGLYCGGALVGAVKRAHEIDVNLNAHVILENLVSKASSLLSLLHLIRVSGVAPSEIDYVIDCSEEACGDMNQRGGGNLAKATAEIAGFENATGADVRAFCAAPVHAILSAASFVAAGTFRNVVVTAGGSTAKLGMNGKDHVKKGIPVLEDCLGGFSVLISANDGINPIIRTDIVGKHDVGTGASPQAVISALVTDPLDKAGLKITDIDRYAPELQNPDITKPAGAGDVPEANYKMIGALGVKRGEIERAALPDFVKSHGLTGWAPTQGHIPSGVPYIGFAREEILEGTISRVMFIGKGSLFLGRMTNLFDGVSFLVEANPKMPVTHAEIFEASEPFDAADAAISVDAATGRAPSPASSTAADATNTSMLVPRTDAITIGIAASGAEHGVSIVREGSLLAERRGLRVRQIDIDVTDPHGEMERLLISGEIDAAVTMHYAFPIGVSTVGRAVTPACGREMYIASTTGASAADRISGMVRNAIHGIIAAKASGLTHPTLGIANVDHANQVERALKKLVRSGYEIHFAKSSRTDGGLMRGNDLLAGTADIMVMDTLSGNLMMKMLSSYTTGGRYETEGSGYGPGIGEGFEKIVLIVSRASGAPVIANAIEYAAQLVKNDIGRIAREEFKKAYEAGLREILVQLESNGFDAHSGGQKNARVHLDRGKGSCAKPDVVTEKGSCAKPDAVTGKGSGAKPDAVTGKGFDAELNATGVVIGEGAEKPPKESVSCEIHGIDVVVIEEAAAALWLEGIYAEAGMGCTGPVVLVSEANETKAREVLGKTGFLEA